MKIAFYNPSILVGYDTWHREIVNIIPNAVVEHYPMCDPVTIDYALVWDPPEDMFDNMSNLKAIFVMGAGVDSLLQNKNLPDVPIIRIVDASIKLSMSTYVLYHVMKYTYGYDLYHLNQLHKIWEPTIRTFGNRETPIIGIMGIGQIGSYIGKKLQSFGYDVIGYRRGNSPLKLGFDFYHGQPGLEVFCATADIIVNVLPLTDETMEIINKDILNYMKHGTCFINIGRGEHVINYDLLSALYGGLLRHVTLDVTDPEPLPSNHPFWTSKYVDITPHIAGNYNVKSMVQELAHNLEEFENESDIWQHPTVVHLDRGY